MPASIERNENREELLRLPRVMVRTGLSKPTIYEMMRREPPDFPRSLKLSRRCVCWSSSAIDRWIEQRIQAGRK